MADGYVERGEVYWIGKLGLANLGVVVSSKQDNFTDNFVAVATICGEEPRRGVSIMATGKQSWVACANVRTVPKSMIRTFVGVLTKEEMAQVDDNLEEFFDLGYVDDSKDKEITSLKSEVARLKREVEYGKEGILSRAAEVSKYKKLYEKAVDQIADMTLAADVAKRIAEKTTVVEVEEEPEPEEHIEEPVEEIVEEPEPEEVNVEEPPKEPEPSKITFPVWEPPVAKPKAPEPVKKVNVNEANIYELMEAGFGKSEAGRIVRWVKKYGKFKNLDDLTKVDGVTGKSLRKIRDGLEV